MPDESQSRINSHRPMEFTSEAVYQQGCLREYLLIFLFGMTGKTHLCVYMRRH